MEARTRLMNDQILLDASEVAAMLSLNKKTFYHFLKSKAGMTFPKPIKFGERLNRWKRQEVEEWVNERASSG
jgi:predicted DNA-binding transcriptional regulator AlpA